jgi:thiol-disulfide isomerase/thioredoxin
MRFSASLTVLLLWAASAIALADDPDPREILTQADWACRSVKAISYRAEASIDGGAPEQTARCRATLKAKQVADGDTVLFNVEGVVKTPDAKESRDFHVVVAEEQVLSLDKQKKVATVGDLPEAVDLFIEPLGMIYLNKFVSPTPFSDELRAGTLEYEDRQDVAGVACDVVHVVYAGGVAEARWHFGVADQLPRRVWYRVRDPRGTVTRVLELRDVDTQPEFDDGTFAIRVPRGYERKKYERPLVSDPKLLPVGSQAPDWTLKTPDGKSVSLSQLRGKVVVLDFWATWCRPCLMAMPGIQKLHERYQGKPVAVFGVNAGERLPNADPVGLMKRNGYTYGLLLNGARVATTYRVIGIPTFYVIGPDGKILYAASGYNPALEDALVRLIDRALAQAD